MSLFSRGGSRRSRNESAASALYPPLSVVDYFDADDIVGLSNGAAVASIGLATQTNPALRPSFVADAGGGHHAVLMELGDELDVSAFGSMRQPLAIIDVIAVEADGWLPHIEIIVMDGVNSGYYFDSSTGSAPGDIYADPWVFTTWAAQAEHRLWKYIVYKGRPTAAQILAIGTALATAKGGTWTP